VALLKRKNSKYYWFRFWFNGQLIQKPTRLTNKKEAEKFEAAYRTKLALGEVGILEQKAAPTLREFEKTFRDYVETHYAKPGSVKFYRDRIKYLMRWEPWRDTRISHIDEALIQRYILARRKQVSITSVNRELATLRRALSLAVEWKLIKARPKIRLLPGEESRTFVLDREKEAKYLAACPPTLRDVATLLIDSGLRLGEAVALKWTDILKPNGDDRYGWIQVRDGKSKNARRTVPITPRVRDLLTERAKNAKSEWIFPGDKPERPICGTSLAHIHAKVCRPFVTENGKLVKVNGKPVKKFLFPEDFVLHSLRHTFLTRMGEVGANPFTIMKTAGHSSVTISQRYVHPTGEMLQLVFDRMIEVAANSSEKSSEETPDTFSNTPNEEAA
jgi:integrase